VIGGAILAAGPSTRFGPRPKQLADLDGRPLLAHAVAAMTAAPGVARVVVVLGAHSGEIAASVDFHGAQPIVAADWRSGQAAALRAAVAELGRDCDAIVVTLGDQPRITPGSIGRVIDAASGPEPAVRAVYRGAPGHPVLVKRPLFARLACTRGDVGARDVLGSVEVHDVECADVGSPVDVDTPAELAALRPRSLS
jgi:molybdenum cofactor cytidylyltransferase